MQTSAVYVPRLTPSERLAAAALYERRARMMANAKPLPVRIEPAPEPPAETWDERQILINPPPKPIWFSIEPEVCSNGLNKIKVADIQRVCCSYFSISMNEMKSPRREKSLVQARQIAAYLAKLITSNSLPEIGRRFGGRDHTTILHAVRKIAGLISKDPDLAETVSSLQREIEAKYG